MPDQPRWDRVERVIALFAHCDDIEMRMGGTFARLIREGKRVTYVVCVENAYVGPHVTERPTAREMLALRRAEATRAAAILGASRVEFLAMKSYYLSREDGTVVYPTFAGPDTLAEELRDVVFDGLPPVHNAYTIPACHDRVLSLIREEQPQLIITQSPDDRHPDHYDTARLATLLVEDLRREGADIDLWYSEPGTGGAMAEFWPSLYVELSEADLRCRQEAFACFPSQFGMDMRPYAQARCAAYGRAAGVPLAEAFRAGIHPRMGDGDGPALAHLTTGMPAPEVIRLAE